MEIELKNIHKAFGSNEVLKGVNLTLKSGEVHALMGENGAGKSTLMNILTGIHKQDKGQIFVDGQEVSFKNPLEAEAHGIAFIHQELNIWPNLSILENLFMMHSITNGMGVLDFKAMRKLAEEKCREIEIELPLDMEAGECSVGQQQMTEIVRNLLVDAKVVIMDEPTAALTERETEKLFEVMRSLKKRGVAMVYISHRMEEVTANCDTITVMRDGVSVATKSVKEYGMEQIIRDMVGRSITEFYPDRRNKPAEVILEVKSFNQTGVFRDVSFNLRKGEILGVAGLMGAGRTEIMRAIFGVDPHESGELVFKGEPLKITKPEDAIKAGMAFVTENRKTEGLILDFSILRNIALPSVDTFAKNSVINFGKLSGFADEMAKKLGVKAHSLELEAGALSGGNQQKVVIAKWVGMNPDVIIMDEPTRGIDVGAKRDIYELMNELTASGVSIIMVSSELPEVLGMSDRILVVHEGRIAGELLRDEADQEKIMTLATEENKHNGYKSNVKKSGSVIGLVALFVVISCLNSSFIDPSNLKNLLRQVSINALISFGMTFVILTGGIDLSVGSILALSSALMGSFIKGGMDPVFWYRAGLPHWCGAWQCQWPGYNLRQGGTVHCNAGYDDYFPWPDSCLY